MKKISYIVIFKTIIEMEELKLDANIYSIYNVLKYSEDCVYLFGLVDKPDFQIIGVNAAFESEFGISESQCLGKCVNEFLGYDVASLVNINLRKCADSMRVIEGIIEMEFPYGMQNYHTTFIPVIDSKGKTNVLVIKRRVSEKVLLDEEPLKAGNYLSSVLHPSGVMKRVKGFTDLNTIMDELKKQEKRILDLVDIAPFGILSVFNKKPFFANKILYEMSGFKDQKSFIEHDPYCFIHPEERKSFKNLISLVFKKKNNGTDQVSIKGIDFQGNSRYLDIRIVYDSIGDYRHIQMIVFDITDQIEKEKTFARLTSASLITEKIRDNNKRLIRDIERILEENEIERDLFKDVIHDLKYDDISQDSTGQFQKHFEELHPFFFEKLRNICPNLTLSEMKHCACIKMNYDTKEIASLFNVNPSSIQKARVRLKKKISHSEPFDLRQLINSL